MCRGLHHHRPPFMAHKPLRLLAPLSHAMRPRPGRRGATNGILYRTIVPVPEGSPLAVACSSKSSENQANEVEAASLQAHNCRMPSSNCR